MPAPISKKNIKNIDLKSYIGIFGAFSNAKINDLLASFVALNIYYTLEDIEDEIECCKYYTLNRTTNIIENSLIKFNIDYTFNAFIIKLNEYDVWFN